VGSAAEKRYSLQPQLARDAMSRDDIWSRTAGGSFKGLLLVLGRVRIAVTARSVGLSATHPNAEAGESGGDGAIRPFNDFALATVLTAAIEPKGFFSSVWQSPWRLQMSKLEKALLLTTAALLSAALDAGSAMAQSRVEGKAPQVRAFPNLTRIYRFTGLVTTSLSSSTGAQVSVTCTNWSPTATTTVRYLFRDFNGTVVGDTSVNLTPLRTLTVSTQFTAFYFEDAVVTLSSTLDQGSLEILATAAPIHCNANVVDAAHSPPSFEIELSRTRNSQESGAHE
jgi:hypothetical protein